MSEPDQVVNDVTDRYLHALGTAAADLWSLGCILYARSRPVAAVTAADRTPAP